MIEQYKATTGESTLRNAVLGEQRARWLDGDRLVVEDYLTRCPELNEDREAVLDLIYQEYDLRRQSGEDPRPHEYVERFPKWSDALIRQFAIDEAMCSTDKKADSATGESEETLDHSKGAGATDGPEPIVSIHGYEIVSKVGQGGMGVVYKAPTIAWGV